MHVVIGLMGLAVALAVLVYVCFVFRRWIIARRGGTFDCSLRLRSREEAAAPPDPDRQDLGQGWTLGTARYAEDILEWYRVFSFSPRPRWVFPRRELEVRGRRVPEGAEALALLSGAVVQECLWRGRPIELAMADDAITGFLAWLESAPPGQHLDVA
jgi:hypothetical protein